MLAPPVVAAFAAWPGPTPVDECLVAAIDPALADTAAFCERYAVRLDRSANCVILAARREGRSWFAACVVLATTHIALRDVPSALTADAIATAADVTRTGLRDWFGIAEPRIALCAFNPHAGDEGLIGREEEDIIKPAIKDAKHQMMVFGPYSADGFFARNYQSRFDAVLAMYHDQGLIPFKSLSAVEGVNFTAGLPMVRTSPDHGTAFDIAGKNKADNSSFLAAVYTCLDIIRNRQEFDENRSNPMRKMGASVLANAEDEKLEGSRG